MLFNSIDFAIFLPIVFILYWIIGSRRVTLQNSFILLASYIFYGWWDWRFLTLIFFSSIVDYLVGITLANEVVLTKRKIYLCISIISNLGILIFFKYYDFFIDNFSSAFSFMGISFKSKSLNIILPVGISFYTFQTLSYSIDVYKKKISPTKNIIVFLAFVSFFPQLVAGPIERANHFIPQFTHPRKLTLTNIQFGFIRILWGLFKKIVIADRLALIVNNVYYNPSEFGGIHYTIATFLFTFQIYCDFSGYSDIAIGSARMFGFKLMENFQTPYFSKSLSSFWRNWHISLSSWFRDYVYIPLGGNRVKSYQLYLNLILVFIISGFWHGAKWTFLAWGALHGIVLVLENLTYNKINILSDKKGGGNLFIKTLFTFCTISFAWILFRANSINDALLIVSNIFNWNLPLASHLHGISLYMGEPLWKLICDFFLIALLLFIDLLIYTKKISVLKIIRTPTIVRWSLYTLLILSIIILGCFNHNQFIYFQF